MTQAGNILLHHDSTPQICDSAEDLLFSPRQRPSGRPAPSADDPFGAPVPAGGAEPTILICSLYHNFRYIIRFKISLSMAEGELYGILTDFFKYSQVFKGIHPGKTGAFRKKKPGDCPFLHRLWKCRMFYGGNPGLYPEKTMIKPFECDEIQILTGKLKMAKNRTGKMTDAMLFWKIL